VYQQHSVSAQVCGEVLDFQMRQLTLISKGAAAAAGGGGGGAGAGVGQPGSSSLGGGKGDLVSRLTLKGEQAMEGSGHADDAAVS
jgi:hypothetical protein